MARTDTDLVLGIVLIVLGALVATGPLSLGWLVVLAAAAAIVVGVLVLAGQIRGTATLGIVLVVLGVLALLPTPFLDALTHLIDIIVGVALIVLGVTKLMGRW